MWLSLRLLAVTRNYAVQVPLSVSRNYRSRGACCSSLLGFKGRALNAGTSETLAGGQGRQGEHSEEKKGDMNVLRRSLYLFC
jgi:hypothetical protein